MKLYVSIHLKIEDLQSEYSFRLWQLGPFLGGLSLHLNHLIP